MLNANITLKVLCGIIYNFHRQIPPNLHALGATVFTSHSNYYEWMEDSFHFPAQLLLCDRLQRYNF